MRKVVWLASYPKSGNTWVRMFLSAYRSGVLDINNLPFVGGDLQRVFYQSVASSPITEMTDTEVMLLRNAALLQMTEFYNWNPLVMKTHSINGLYDGTPMIPPALTAAAIYVVRDPRDVVMSYARHLGVMHKQAEKDMEHEGTRIVDSRSGLFHVLSSWSNHVRSWAGADFPVALVRYEDLIEDPRRNFTAILQFLGIEIDKERFNNALRLTKLDNLRDQELKKGFVENPKEAKGRFFGKGGSKWQVQLDKRISARIAEVHGEMMQECGYGPAGNTREDKKLSA